MKTAALSLVAILGGLALILWVCFHLPPALADKSEMHPPPTPASKWEMACEEVNNEHFMFRCENKEAVCYSRSLAAPSCWPKD